VSEGVINTSEFDVVVVGGGINGAGIAADAAGRGLTVLLCEKSDLGGATSSSSSKLIHGGLRYLEHYEFALVRQSLGEREVLLAKAPHIIWPLKFRLPHQPHLRPAWMIRLGLFLYDHLAKRKVFTGSRKMNNDSSSPLVADITTCFEYSDGWVDDARLVVLNALAAKQAGAVIRPQTEVIAASKNGTHWLITLKDRSGQTTKVTTRTIVNAAGPWAINLLDKIRDVKHQNAMRLVKGSHIIVKQQYPSDEAYILQNEDGRIVFVIPFEDDFTLIGTTDEDYVGDPALVQISEAEKDYLIDVTNKYFKRKISKQDIVHCYSGVRPLLEEKNASAQELTRDYKFQLSGDQATAVLLNVFGGKITTYRKLSEHAVNQLARFFPKARKAWTKDSCLPGGDFANRAVLTEQICAQYPWLPKLVVKRYVRQYGLLCEQILSNKQGLSELGQDFGYGLYQSEIDYLIEHEWATSLEDIIWRRTKHGLRLNDEQKAVLSLYIENKTTKQVYTLHP
jgi:glycerol-3-phosphate dehydrogenase